MSDPTVRIDALTIPDRIDGQKLRLCIQLVPSLSSCMGGAVKLSEWPAEIAKRAGAIRVWRARLEAGKVVDPEAVGVFAADIADLMKVKPTGSAPAAPGGTPPDSLALAATAKWQRIFQEPGFETLYKALLDQAGGTIAQCIARGDAIGITSAKTALLDRVLEAAYRKSAIADHDGHVPDDLIDRSAAAFGMVAQNGGLDFASRAEQGRKSVQDTASRWLGDGLATHLVEKEVVGACSAAAEAFDGRGAGIGALDNALAEFGAIMLADEAPDPNAPPPPEPTLDPAETAMRKLNNLLAFPTIAKYFGMCADILLPADAFGTGEYSGLVAVELKDPAASDFGPAPKAADLVWTAVAHRVPPGRSKRTFSSWDGEGQRPAGNDLTAIEKKLYVDGLLNLRHRVNGKPSFHLGSGEVVSTMLRLAEKLAADNGEPPSKAKALPAVERKTKGLVLYHENVAELLVMETRRELEVARCGEMEPKINFSDNLGQGFRFDVQLLTMIGDRQLPRWRSLMARDIEYAATDIDAAFLTHPSVRAVRYRDDGVAMTPIAEQPTGGKSLYVATQELMAWGGGSLAVAATPNIVDIDIATDVPITMTFRPPPQPQRLPPPLRLARRYAVRARLALPLGCGLTFDDVQADPENGLHSLPEIQGFGYQRYEQVGAPVVLFHWDSPMVKAKVAGDWGGRSIEQLVVRDGDPAFASDTRYVLPPRVSIDEAEQQGQFDQAKYDGSRAPSGAFEGVARVVLYGPDGQLPEARLGAATWYDRVAGTFNADGSANLTSDQIRDAQTRGAVLVMSASARTRQVQKYDAGASPQPRYYPDRYSRRMIASLVKVKGFTPPDPISGAPRTAEFWSSGGPGDARPIQLKLVRAPEDPAKPSSVAIGQASLTPPGEAAIQIPSVTVSLQPGDIVDLELFADPKAAELRAAHKGGALVADLGDYKPDQAWSTARKQLCNVRTVRLIHAVKKPLAAPKFVPPKAGAAVMQAITLTVKPDKADPKDTRRTWEQVVVDGEPFASEEGGSTTFFAGAIRVHGRTTGAVRCEARWDDYGPAAIKREPGIDTNGKLAPGRWYSHHPRRYADLFTISHLSSAEVDSKLELLREQGALRKLAYAFEDGRARKLSIRLVAASRFSNFYPADAAPDDDIERVGPYERPSHDFENAPVVWTNCTFRPPPPVIDRVLPLLDWNYPKPTADRIGFSRRNRLRIFLEPSWYASGEGEKVALIFDQNPNREICDYEKTDLRPFADLVTRWGRDPIHDTRHVDPLPIGYVSGGEKVTELYLHASASGDPKSPAPPPLAVDIVAIEPVLDPVIGLYCDIGIGPAIAKEDAFLTSYMPFVQLGLARYQEHAVSKLRLSHAVQHMAQLLPDRIGFIELKGPKNIVINLTGPIFGTANDIEIRPRLNVRLMQEKQVENRKFWAPAEGSLAKTQMIDQLPNPTDDVTAVWSIPFELPRSRDEVHYGVLIEEYEQLYADPPELDQDAPRGSDPLEGAELTMRGPVFSTMIDLSPA